MTDAGRELRRDCVEANVRFGVSIAQSGRSAFGQLRSRLICAHHGHLCAAVDFPKADKASRAHLTGLGEEQTLAWAAYEREWWEGVRPNPADGTGRRRGLGGLAGGRTASVGTQKPLFQGPAWRR